MKSSPIDILKQLVRIPSVNPMGREAVGGIFGEAALTKHLRDVCNAARLSWLQQRVHDERDNLIAVLPGEPSTSAGGPLLLWEVHQDTVAVEGMTVEPFGAEIRDGRLFGRGACDVKGGMAAMLAALLRLAESAPTQRPTIVLAFTVNEEFGFSGAEALKQLWSPAGCAASTADHDVVDGTVTPQDVFPRRPDAAIVAEPTELNVVVAHKGGLRWQCHTIGKATHTSDPDLGQNAIYGMARIVQAIETYHREVAATLPAHPLCGPPTVCVSTITGGVGVNTVPDRATIDIDRRLAPAENPDEAYRQLIEYLSARVDPGGCRIEHDKPNMKLRGLLDVANRDLAERLAHVVRPLHPTCQRIGARYGTDAAVIAESEVPTVVFGPGSINQAHTADEWIALDQLEQAAEILFRLAVGWPRAA